MKEERKPLSERNVDVTFAGIRYHFSDRYTPGQLTNYSSSLTKSPSILKSHATAPVAHDALKRLLIAPSSDNTVVLEHQHNARRIIGLTSFIASVRGEVNFAFKVLARFVNERRLTNDTCARSAAS